MRSVGELRESGRDYRVAVPVLLNWLPKVTHSALREAIAHTLSVSYAKPDAARPSIGTCLKTLGGLT